MAKLNQVIAIEKGVKARSYAIISELHKSIQKPALFNGGYRNYKPKTEGGETLPPEKVVVQLKVSDVLRKVRTAVSELVDVTVQKDEANTRAFADVTIDGETVLAKVPVTSLLMLEKQLTDLRTFCENLPVLDNAEAWTPDAHSGLFVTEPVSTHRTKKVQTSLVLLQPTDKHPGQAQMITDDQLVGFWELVKQSSALPAPDKELMVDRANKLLLAVKEARERANDTEVEDRPKVGDKIFEFLLRK